MLAVFASKLRDLLGFFLILSRMHLIIDLNRWERGLPHLGQSDKSPLSLKRFNVFQTVDLAIESVFAKAESYFPARCNASIASLLPDVFELAKVSHKNKWWCDKVLQWIFNKLYYLARNYY